ncbi:inorganic phosphate transporter, PiT family [Halomicrobium zhouii]|uniref:Phosphate transporter n=1 Tax=Halomicrobium zhouii TaxID=767519 RepID=A0A1I6LUT7_9EURY|nr:inorganic phosphate transporter [Halomicrobium zhouii]SFS07217.1 inorganic phosphate transporter, PiT family [Halomicrobium zhouii]
MVDGLLVVGLLVAAFVGYNIGGSSTGVAFGPAVGSRILGKATAAGLFTVFALLGGWTIGRNVIETMSSEIVPATQFSLTASVGVLFFAGASLLISNLYGVPASTSMTAVGAIVGLGLATGTLREEVMFRIVSAWIIAPLLAFLVGMLIGRYLYPHLDARFTFTRLENPLVRLDRSGAVPRPAFNDRASLWDVLGAALVLVIACYMGFSAGASNAGNAVAPLVGSGAVSVESGILLAIGSIGLGGFTIARRTLATVGDGITELPILAALIVSTIGATVITVLSRLGIPASLAVSTTCCIIGLGWGRASRAVTVAEAAKGAVDPDAAQFDEGAGLTTGALTADDPETGVPSGPTLGTLAASEREQEANAPGAEEDIDVPPIGEEDFDDLAAESLFDPAATSRIVFLWALTPTISTIGAYVLFSIVL